MKKFPLLLCLALLAQASCETAPRRDGGRAEDPPSQTDSPLFRTPADETPGRTDLPQTGTGQPAPAQADTTYMATFRQLVQAIKTKQPLQRFVHSLHGVFVIVRPGAYDAIYRESTADSAIRRIYNGQYVMSQLPTTVTQALRLPQGEEICDAPHTGTVHARVRDYNRVSTIQSALERYQVGYRIKPEDQPHMQAIEGAAEAIVLDYRTRVAIVLVRFDQKWYVGVIDTGTYSCSA